MLIFLIVIAALVAGLVLFAVTGINRLRGQRVRVDEALGGIDVQLTRRAELIPNLVETVKGYAAHEQGTFDKVTQARAAVQAAKTAPEMAAADGIMRQAIAGLFAVAEAYPDLKASTNFQQLQSELARTEDQLAFARQYYNDSAATLNTTMVTIPWSLLVGPSGVTKAEFYDAPEGNEAAPQVSFALAEPAGAASADPPAAG
ncbi:MAG: LemA family protein [Baekduia sp.]